MIGLAALLIGCGDGRDSIWTTPTTPTPDTPTVPDTTIQRENYSFTIKFLIKDYSSDGWAVEAIGRLYNDGNEDIIGLKPRLRLYPSLEDAEQDNWIYSHYGELSDSIRSTPLGYFSVDKTDTIPVGGFKYHLTKSDTLDSGFRAHYRFGFEYQSDFLPKKTNKYLEGKLNK